MHFCTFSPAGFHGSWCPCHCPQRWSTAASSSSHPKSGRVAESSSGIPGTPAYCMMNWGPTEQSKRAWLKALWWEREAGICAWVMFPHSPFSPEVIVVFCQPSEGCVWGIPYWVAVRGFSCKCYLKSQRSWKKLQRRGVWAAQILSQILFVLWNGTRNFAQICIYHLIRNTIKIPLLLWLLLLAQSMMENRYIEGKKGANGKLVKNRRDESISYTELRRDQRLYQWLTGVYQQVGVFKAYFQLA